MDGGGSGLRRNDGPDLNIRITCPCIEYPLKPHCYIVNLECAGVYLFFHIFATKHRLWVLVRTASAVVAWVVAWPPIGENGCPLGLQYIFLV